jgi:hypothetical protein
MTSPEIRIIDIGGTPYISAADAAHTSGFSARYITRLAASGRIPARRLGRSWFVALSALRSLTS